MIVPIVTTIKRLGYYSYNKKEPIIYEAIYQSNKKNPIQYIVRTIKNNYRRVFKRENEATQYLRILLKKMEKK
jgi:hypothetical protein